MRRIAPDDFQAFQGHTQRSDIKEMGITEKNIKLLSENNGSDNSNRPDLEFLSNLSTELATLINAADSSAKFQLKVLETATKDMAKKIRNEANVHCEKVKEIAQMEIEINKRPSSEVLKEYSQVKTEIIQGMEEQLNKLQSSQKASMRSIEDRVLNEMIETMEMDLEPRKKTFFNPQNAGKHLSLCHRVVNTLDSIICSIILFGACTYAYHTYITSYYG